MQTNQNQALTMYPLFFDPIYKKVHFEKTEGMPKLTYKDDAWGVQVHENGDVTFSMFAPEAEKVEVAGFGGCFSRDKIALTKDEKGLFASFVLWIVFRNGIGTCPLFSLP